MTEIRTTEDVIARIEYLVGLGTPDLPDEGDNEFTGLDQDEANELEALRKRLLTPKHSAIEALEWCDTCEVDTPTDKPGLYRRWCSECGEERDA